MKQENLKACKGCQDRKVGCHGSCEKYKQLQAYYEEVRKEKCKANDYYDYAVKTTITNKGRERWF